MNIPVMQVSLISALQKSDRNILGQGAGDGQNGYALQQLHNPAGTEFVHRKEQDIQMPAWLAVTTRLMRQSPLRYSASAKSGSALLIS